jgi:two-component system, NtrC family, sensor kinase
VLLYSDILLRECPPGDPRRADLEMIVGETKRCKGIVASLLDFARQNQVEAEPTDVNALIGNVVEVQQKLESYAGIIVVTDLDPNLPKIEADPAQLEEVFVNLMSNGVDAMAAGGTLTLRTRCGPVGMVTVEVADTGEGIAPEHLSKLFTPFFSTKPVGKGTGLGLAIVYGIVKMHRGQINVRSQVGQGTTFSIQLPTTLAIGQPFGASRTAPATPGAEKLIGGIGE